MVITGRVLSETWSQMVSAGRRSLNRCVVLRVDLACRALVLLGGLVDHAASAALC